MPSIVWKGQLTFGLVSVPVKLYRAARRESVRLHYVHQPAAVADEPGVEPSHSIPPNKPLSQVGDRSAVFAEPEPLPIARVKQHLVRTDDEQPISRSEVLRGYEVEPERFVVLDPTELKRLRKRTSPTMEIIRAVQLAEIDPVFYDVSYYVVPDRGSEKAYALLFVALQQTGRVALARVGMYGREHIVVVRPGGSGLLAHTIFYTDEIRAENEFRTSVQGLGTKELDLAKLFLEAIEAPFDPEEFTDSYREELQSLITEKITSAEIVPAGPKPITGAPPAVDILEALKKSIAAAKKPASPVPPRKAPGRVTEIKHKRKTVKG